MPTISRFFGIIIQMYWNDHNPPHFHARYGETTGIIDIQILRMLEGNLSGRTISLVIEWAKLHQTELMNAWQQCVSKNQPSQIEPLS